MAIVKLVARPEGRPNVWLVYRADLEPWLDHLFTTQDHIHNYIAADDSSMIFGADWTRESFDELLVPEAQWAVVTQDAGTFAGHRLVCVVGMKRYVFDVGPITADDLETAEVDF